MLLPFDCEKNEDSVSVTELQFEDFVPPPASEIERRIRVLRWYFQPTIEGLEHLSPARPGLLVGNHTIYGVIDSPLFFSEVYTRTGVFPRSLGDHSHFQVPLWRNMLIRYGVVPGTRENCARLMQAGQHILVFPGGAREVAKRKDEVNRLTWKQRTGFVSMAISHGYDIIPFASVGADETYSILFDGDDFASSRLGKRLLEVEPVNRFLRGGDVFMPLARGIGPTTIPRPEPFSFSIGAPVSTREYMGRETEPETLWMLREQVASKINSMIARLEARRAVRQHKLPMWRRWRTLL